MNGASFSMYEVLGYLMPGSVVVLPLYYWASATYPSNAALASDGVMTATAFLVLSFLVGHFLQAVSSGPLERFYLWLSGGHPNKIIATKGIKPMKPEYWLSAKRAILLNSRRCTSETEVPGYDDEETIRIAISRSRGKGKTDVFNALYAFNRGLTTGMLVLFCLVLIYTKYVVRLNILWYLLLVLLCLLILIVQLFRLRNKSEYFLDESIRQAEDSY